MRLVFVYNAEAGLLNGIWDSLHKAFSPATYPCALCAITHGAVSMDGKWRRWLDRLDTPPRFFHRSDFRGAWPDISVELPAILVETRSGPRPFMEAADFAGITDVDQLIPVLEARLAKVAHDDPAI